MSGKGKNVLLWLLAIVLTFSLVIYQRATGPTYPVKGKTDMNGEVIKYSLIRSFMGERDATIEVNVPSNNFAGEITFKRFKSHDDWTTIPMKYAKGKLTGDLPNQPPAGKIEYFVKLIHQGKSTQLTEDPVIIRYTGSVPMAILSPHIFFMFLSLLFGLRVALELIFKGKDAFFLSGVVVITLFLGGLILGPLVQKYAFDAYWTGWPFGHDLTDNKTIVSFILWVVAWFALRKNRSNKLWPTLAIIGMLAVYLIPHSVLGSEIDHTKAEKTSIEQPLNN
jgi:hypothetical protein